MRVRQVFILVFLLAVSLSTQAQVPDVVTCSTVCPDGRRVTFPCKQRPPCYYGPPAPDPKEVERREKQRVLKTEGIAASEEGNWADAVKYFTEALGYGPDPEISRMLKDAIHHRDELEADEAEKVGEVTAQLARDLNAKENDSGTGLTLMKSAPPRTTSGLSLMKPNSLHGPSQREAEKVGEVTAQLARDLNAKKNDSGTGLTLMKSDPPRPTSGLSPMKSNSYAEKVGEVTAQLARDLNAKKNDSGTGLTLMKSAPPRSTNGLSLMKSPSLQESSQQALRNALEDAAKSPTCTGNISCNFFVGYIGTRLKIPYFKNVLTTNNPDHYVANKMYDFISKAGQSRPSGWRLVGPDDAQRMADSGKFVIAVARSVSPQEHGHIAIVVPSEWDHKDEPGTTPWVRDGENPKFSRRASQRFGSSVGEPLYAVWKDPKETR